LKFGEVNSDNAIGSILAHSIYVGKERFRKGKVLSKDDVAKLNQCSVKSIVVARLSSDDVHEDLAALEIASAISASLNPKHFELSRAFTGRVNIISKVQGVVELNVDIINRLNLIDPMLTCATLVPFSKLEIGTLIATVKIIAYSIPKTVLASGVSIAGDSIRIHPVVISTADLVISRIGNKDLGDKGIKVIERRLNNLGIKLISTPIVRHTVKDLADGIGICSSQMILMLTASATSDVLDVGPEALTRSGGKLVRFGMPADPGNLLFFGYLDSRSVIGLPGCARSPSMNGVDWVLERLSCGLTLTDRDISFMGVGGLLKEMSKRPQPRRG
jgi:molybdenum cofactor cytidylyltransferase